MMRTKLCILLILCQLYGCTRQEDNVLDYVNPNIGTTHSRWFFYTPAAVPFGMAKLAPSTNGSYSNQSGWEAVGYEDVHTSIEGFPCFHEFQIGGLVLMPVVGELKTQPGTLDDVASGYRSSFDKPDEYATAGYYSVLLKDYDVKAELTATKRVGFQRYTFPQTGEAYIIFDIGSKLGENGDIKDAYINMVDNETIEGYIITYPHYVRKYQEGGDVRMYFHAKLSAPAAESKVFLRGEDPVDGKEIKGVGSAMALRYETKENQQITVKLGLSYTSVENARLNLISEASGMSFDQAKSNALNTWNEYLSRIKVSGGKEADRVKFYTGLFHALLGRGLASDVNGAYPMNSGAIGQIELNKDNTPKHNHYNTDAIWGAFWNLTQLWALAYPEYYSDWIQSQLLVYKETGWLGDGIANSKYVSGVGTNFVSLVIASAYNCGIRDFDIELGYEAALKNEVGYENRIPGAGKLDVADFLERGYSPYISRHDASIPEAYIFGTSHTMEYSFSAFAVAQFAKHLGKEDDYLRLSKLADGWQLLFDEQTQLIRPRTEDGEFIENFDPLAPWIGFQEGNAVQYTFYVPHQPEKLIELVGREEFNNRLDSIFTISEKDYFSGGTELNAFSGLHTVYNHGNQPNLHTSWLFNFSGKPHLSQKWVHAICNKFYGTDGVHGYGYGQDEDQGQLGAWYVMSSLGLFDVKALTEINPKFQVGTPLFDKVEIQLNEQYYPGGTFTIEKTGAPEHLYIQSASYNNDTLDTLSLPFSKLVNGGTLHIRVGAESKKYE